MQCKAAFSLKAAYLKKKVLACLVLPSYAVNGMRMVTCKIYVFHDGDYLDETG
jgi:hypothetical protein